MHRALVFLACCAVLGAGVSLALADDEDDEAHRRDLRELIRHGGTLPEGYVPQGGPPIEMPDWWRHGSRDPDAAPPALPLPEDGPGLTRVSGRILKRYLEVRGDAAAAAVYTEALDVLADVLIETPANDQGGAARLGRALTPLLLRSLEDERKAPACAELMEILQGGPLELGGALLLDTPDGLVVHRVPAGSLAEAMTLRVGDRIAPSSLPGARRALEDGDKLILQVRRMDGVVERLEIELSRDVEPK